MDEVVEIGEVFSFYLTSQHKIYAGGAAVLIQTLYKADRVEEDKADVVFKMEDRKSTRNYGIGSGAVNPYSICSMRRNLEQESRDKTMPVLL